MRTDHSIEMQVKTGEFNATVMADDDYVIVRAPEELGFLRGKSVNHAIAICRNKRWKVVRLTPLRVSGREALA